LLTISPIDPILVPLTLYFCWDHFSDIGKYIHHLLAHTLSMVLNSGHRPILLKNFIQLLFTPLRSPPQSFTLDWHPTGWTEDKSMMKFYGEKLCI
jgi:hypothetical protein